MNILHQLSFLYPNAVAVVGILIAFAVIYFAGKALAWVFYSTEKKVESEPSIMTEYDRINRIEHRMKYDKNMLAEAEMYGDEITSLIKSHTDRVTKCYKERVEILEKANNRLEAHCNEYKDLLDSCMTTIIERDDRIAELEKELSDLRSSCDDSFLNTIERANQLNLKCASLENTIAEFDVYKKDAQEVHDKLTKLYDAEVAAKKDLSSKLWRSRREVASLKRDLISATAQIAELGEKYSSAERERSEYESMYNSILAQYAKLKVKLNAIEQDKPAPEPKPAIDLSWVKWVATDQTGAIWAYEEKPIKLNYSWEAADEGELITPVMAIVLCDRVPEWSDYEPTPVINK